ncbi:histone deacetylase complex subunit SAP130-B isoform X2 [Chironomus tepperi]|uniref:histone deacetylase complex subunit SAP130-B isoform X2 n=1 Tax=Chironomus tepperi TaxID=113505 RepID=UPI00391F7D3B
MPNENEKSPIQQNKPTIHATQLPIDLASKVIVKPANDSKMIQQPTFRTIQQPAQMRVVRMPTPSGTQIIQTQLVPQTILKTPMQQTGRSTITVSKSPAATYLPRVTATLSTIPQNKAGQQIRTPTPPVSATTMSPAFVRSITPRTSSPTAVLSQGGTAWVAGGNAMQVQVPTQLIRSTITQNRTHILQPSAVTVTNNAGNAQTITNIFGQQNQQQNLGGNTTISVTTSGGSGQTQQPTYVATVLPQRPQSATIVYTSQQQQPFTAIQGQVQRMGIANSVTNTRQVRPIQRIPTTGIRVNTSSLSIRPNVPGLTPTTVLTTQNRGTSGLVAGTSTTISNTIPARIFQVQTSQNQSVTGSQQVIGQQNQKILQANVMTLPIIVNNRINPQVKNTLQPGIIAHVSKLQPGSVSSDGTIISNSITTTIPSNTMVASIQAGQQNQSHTSQLQVSQGGSQGSYSTQSSQQIGNLSNQSGSQIITVSQQQTPQIIQGQSNLHQQGSNVSTVVPLQISARGGNIPIKTITVSTANTGGLDASSLHRNLSSNAGSMQATTIMPIAKLVQSQQQNLGSGQNSNQPTSVFIQTRIPSTMSTTNSNQVVNVSTPSSTIFSSSGTTVFYEPASVSIAPSSSSSHGNIEAKSTSISTPTNESSSFTVVSAPNIRYTDKMIQSIIANSYSQANSASNIQQQSSVSQSHPQTVRYSPLVVESQNSSSQNQQHQIITMTSGNIIQQAASQQQQQNQQIQSTSIESSVITALPASPRSTVSAIRKQNETTPIKIPKKATKPTTSTKQESKPIPVAAASSSPKGLVISERESSPAHIEGDWSDDGSTTVSIPNSPSPEEDDLDAMIMSNQFNRKSQDETDLSKFIKTVAKLGSAVKRELSDQAVTPKKKQKISHERPSTDVVDKAGPPEPAESTENIVVKKRDVILKKPTVMLLNAYNQNWKPAPNHFMRYADVRVRGDDRRANVMDLANQPKVSQRINGWKTHLINAEIDEVINDETCEMETLTSVLKRLEAKESGPEAEKINELIKGNMQRSRLIVDSFNDSKAQLMKIFEHKEHALDIVNRCVSKRNFKKR